jgi:hypothetical protein
LCWTATLPLVLVAATAPLVQGWFAMTGHPRASDPYFLYAASNTGSLLALAAYPFVIEPNLGLAAQSQLWLCAFLVLLMLIITCGVMAGRLTRSQAVCSAQPEPKPRLSFEVESISRPAKWLRWVVAVFVPSSWLLGVTAYLTTDLAPVPLFWTVPLALYLLSFILAFARLGAAAVRVATRLLPYILVPLVLVMSAGFVHPVWIPLHLVAFFVGSVACHGALAEARPGAKDLSAFYVTIALGGFLGGIWGALVAPLTFDRVVEYPLAMVLACLIALPMHSHGGASSRKSLLIDVLFAGVVFLLTLTLVTNQAGLADSVLGAVGVALASGLGALSCVIARQRPVRFALVLGSVLVASSLAVGPSGRLLHVERNFFGIVRVTYDPAQNANRLFHGSTLHGQQSLDASLRQEPLTYFTRSGPVGQLFEAIQPRLTRQGVQVAVIGLGAGTLTSYARPGQHWTFYEIDAAIERIARDPRYFRYLEGCRANRVDIVLGDARQQLERAPDGAYSLLVLDAFSSDMLPVHLISREAIRLYRTKLAAGGLLLFNLSNRYLDLDSVIGRQADDVGLICRVCHDLRVSDEEKRAGKQPSIWAVMAATATDLGKLSDNPRWQSPIVRPRAAVWTDDYSDLASALILTPAWRRRSQ